MIGRKIRLADVRSNTCGYLYDRQRVTAADLGPWRRAGRCAPKLVRDTDVMDAVGDEVGRHLLANEEVGRVAFMDDDRYRSYSAWTTAALHERFIDRWSPGRERPLAGDGDPSRRRAARRAVAEGADRMGTGRGVLRLAFAM
jgi:hypothetical protein